MKRREHSYTLEQLQQMEHEAMVGYIQGMDEANRIHIEAVREVTNLYAQKIKTLKKLVENIA